ncbi:hypothetical protein CABS01_03300 [Colletotrichum abscissum]|uniref:uncharacterized protein n=1 Tax=Colletotrichum abscissum TaxID=1671311 RepID=UPI0027D5B406|nr:uncharacterized protein CABS01_03300 [Colletotrichum abscissum]KAK1477998.1 hypothetical protein CABS01_03300 [Colletotrichum abscissum]
MVFPLLHETTAEASQEDHRCPPACDPTGIDWWTEIPISKDSNSPSCLAVPVVGVPFLAQSHSTAKTTNGMHNKGGYHRSWKHRQRPSTAFIPVGRPQLHNAITPGIQSR